MAEVAVEIARALVDEQELVAIRVAREVIHAARRALCQKRTRTEVLVSISGARPGLGRCLRSRSREVEGMRPQRPLERDPPRGRMPVMQMGRGAEEPFLADLPLVGAGRQVGVRLARGGALDVGVGDVALHGAHR